MGNLKMYCEHLNIKELKTTKIKVCEECVKIGGK